LIEICVSRRVSDEEAQIIVEVSDVTWIGGLVEAIRTIKIES
jgi:hypothetical protein